MLRALVAKELREHTWVAIVAVSAGSALATLAVRPVGAVEVPLRQAHYLDTLTMLSIGYGLLLGFALTWKEELRKTWPFLIHRPPGRDLILGAKLLSGLALYFFPVALPVVYVAVLSATPGRYAAPFVAHDILWPAEALLRGLALMLGAFAAGLWSGRARLLPPIGVGTLLVAAATPVTWPAAFGAVAATALLALGAAWHVFVRAPRLRFALAILLAAGATGLLLVADQFLATFLPEPSPWENRQYQFSLDGEPQVVVGGSIARIETLDGRTMATGVDRRDDRIADSASLGGDVSPWSPLLRLHATALLRSDPERVWHIDLGSSLIRVYDSRTSEPIAWIGRDGPAAERATATPFPRIQSYDFLSLGSGSAAYQRDELTLLTEGGVFQVRLDADRHVTEVTAIPVTGIGDARARIGGTVERVLVLRSQDSIGLRRTGEGRVRWFPLPEAVRDAGWIGAGPIGEDRLGVIAASWEPLFDGGIVRTRLLTVDAAGTVLWEHETFDRIPSRGLSAYVLPLAPGIHATTLAVVDALWRTATGFTFLSPVPLGLLLAKGLACALLAFVLLRGRGLSPGRRIAWSAFALLTAEAGLVAIAALLLTERRIPCPSCGGKRLPSLPACPRCGAAWPAPAPREIDLLPQSASV